MQVSVTLVFSCFPLNALVSHVQSCISGMLSNPATGFASEAVFPPRLQVVSIAQNHWTCRTHGCVDGFLDNEHKCTMRYKIEIIKPHPRMLQAYRSRLLDVMYGIVGICTSDRRSIIR